MTIVLTKDVRVGGSVLASGTTQTLAADVEADLVARGCATPSGLAPGVEFEQIRDMYVCTQAQYNAITPNPKALYVIVG